MSYHRPNRAAGNRLLILKVLKESHKPLTVRDVFGLLDLPFVPGGNWITVSLLELTRKGYIGRNDNEGKRTASTGVNPDTYEYLPKAIERYIEKEI